ncbi:MAG: hypothetical protein LBH81_01880 [Rickettsiales bacterium]|jgi:hypothetical protein|nr:hypothetical protein [Rickettsiales bacterium]
MRNIFVLVLGLAILGACCNCKSEPIVEQNKKLIVPPNIGKIVEVPAKPAK